MTGNQEFDRSVPQKVISRSVWAAVRLWWHFGTHDSGSRAESWRAAPNCSQISVAIDISSREAYLWCSLCWLFFFCNSNTFYGICWHPMPTPKCCLFFLFFFKLFSKLFFKFIVDLVQTDFSAKNRLFVNRSKIIVRQKVTEKKLKIFRFH